MEGNSIELLFYILIPLFFGIILFLFNFEITAVFFVISFFISEYLSYATAAEFFTFFVILSFLINYKFEIPELKNDFNKAAFFFLICILLSFTSYTRVNDFFSIFRIITFALIYIITSIALTDFEKIKKLLVAFLALSVLNGIVVIYWALLTNKRVFGFAGIMYVDYAGICLTACLIYLLYGKKFKIILTFAFIIVLMALIFTQTRNAWISTGLTLILAFSHFIFFNKSLRIALTKKIFLFCFVLFTTTIVSIQALNLNPEAYSRVETDISKTNSGEVKINTFVTRLFIWQTAFNAFQKHPITGIGLYAFSNHSSEYNTLPPIIYKAFVEDLSPHQTFIQILCETGLIGFVGFMYFLFNFMRISRYNLKISISRREILYANIFFWISFYIIISMFMTDAWLQGGGLILWSMIIGSTLAIAKIIKKKNV